MTKAQLNDKITEQRKKALELCLELRTIHDNLGTVKHKNLIKILYEKSLEELDELVDKLFDEDNNNTKN